MHKPGQSTEKALLLGWKIPDHVAQRAPWKHQPDALDEPTTSSRKSSSLHTGTKSRKSRNKAAATGTFIGCRKKFLGYFSCEMGDSYPHTSLSRSQSEWIKCGEVHSVWYVGEFSAPPTALPQAGNILMSPWAPAALLWAGEAGRGHVKCEGYPLLQAGKETSPPGNTHPTTHVYIHTHESLLV